MHVRPLSKKDPLPGCKPGRLPNAILRAIDHASHVIGIPRCVKDTFAEICRYVKQSDPLSSIWPTKEAIAERIGADKRTVHRHIAWLRENGLIEVLPQCRKNRNGKFIYSPIKLTRKAAELVMLIEPISLAKEAPPSDILSLGHTLTESSNTKIQPTTLVNNLPSDLNHLTSLGVQKMGVFKLMKMATTKGKRLSDIVTVFNQQLSDKRGGYIFGFLENKINDKKDYSYIAKLAKEKALQQEALVIQESKARQLKKEFQRTSFTNAKKTMIFHIDAKSQFVQVISPKSSSTEIFSDPITWQHQIESGIIVAASKEGVLEVMENINRLKQQHIALKREKTYQLMFGQSGSTQQSQTNEPIKPITTYSREIHKIAQKADKLLKEVVAKLPIGREENMKLIFSLLHARKINC